MDSILKFIGLQICKRRGHKKATYVGSEKWICARCGAKLREKEKYTKTYG